LAAKWEPEKYHDTFEENLKKLIKARMEGGEVTTVEKPRKQATPTDLMAALRQSLEQMGKKKGPQRVEDVQRESEVRIQAAKGPGKKRAKRAA
jgi:DNA end-binding protein Ku